MKLISVLARDFRDILAKSAADGYVLEDYEKDRQEAEKDFEQWAGVVGLPEDEELSSVLSDKYQELASKYNDPFFKDEADFFQERVGYMRASKIAQKQWGGKITLTLERREHPMIWEVKKLEQVEASPGYRNKEYEALVLQGMIVLLKNNEYKILELGESSDNYKQAISAIIAKESQED